MPPLFQPLPLLTKLFFSLYCHILATAAPLGREDIIMSEKKSILVVVAHADDMEFFAGGTVAKLVKMGHEVTQVITTNNEKGSFTLDRETLIQKSREEEAKESGKFLGLKEVIFLEYPDGEVMHYPGWELRGKLMRIVRKVKPHALFTWDPFAPYETHPDHRTVGMAATEAAEFAHLPLYFPEHKEEGLQPHYVSEYYFFAKNPQDTNKIVDITGTINLKIDSLMLHESQMYFTLEDVRMGLKSAGLNAEDLGFPEKMNRANARQVLDTALKAMAAEAGMKTGAPYAEEFRHRSYGLAKQVFGELLEGKDIL